MDHACIVWCKQLVLATIRALFDSINPNTRQLSSEHTFRLAAFRHHLLLVCIILTVTDASRLTYSCYYPQIFA